jgi:hypothetical protein
MALIIESRRPKRRFEKRGRSDGHILLLKFRARRSIIISGRDDRQVRSESETSEAKIRSKNRLKPRCRQKQIGAGNNTATAENQSNNKNRNIAD